MSTSKGTKSSVLDELAAHTMQDTDKDAGKEASADDIPELMTLSNMSTSDTERDPDEECERFTVF